MAVLIHDASLSDEPQLVGAVTSAAGIALENERLQADLRARLSDLKASRARIVEAGDAARRRLERDLHDGAQQRLVSLSVDTARRARTGSPDEPLLQTARDELSASLEELRNIARGIHPAVLSDHGLPVALESLAARAPVKVTLDVDLPERPPAADRGRRLLPGRRRPDQRGQVRRRRERAHPCRAHRRHPARQVEDDGKGGADPAAGSGLRGLADRVEALGGRLRLWSPSGGGTTLRAEIPCA